MKRLSGTSLSPDVLDTHAYICDLINVEYPVLQLWTDGKSNWIYLWCDRGVAGTNRWLVFTASRPSMIRYLERKMTMKDLVIEAAVRFVLDTSQPVSFGDAQESGKRRHRRTVTRTALDQLQQYLPSDDSYFDEELTSDLDLSKQLTPTNYSVPIAGDWFGQDFTFLFKSYERLYAFFYATQPRFVRTLSHNLERLLRSPWTGGFSRVNLFAMLPRQVPGLHSLKVERMEYASPGEVKFEAISSVGDSVRVATNRLVEHEESVLAAVKDLKRTLTDAGVNSRDLSLVDDKNTPISPVHRSNIEDACGRIASLLNVETEFATLRHHSPNIVVFAKAVASFIRQLTKLADLERQGMLNFSALAPSSQHPDTKN